MHWTITKLVLCPAVHGNHEDPMPDSSMNSTIQCQHCQSNCTLLNFSIYYKITSLSKMLTSQTCTVYLFSSYTCPVAKYNKHPPYNPHILSTYHPNKKWSLSTLQTILITYCLQSIFLRTWTYTTLLLHNATAIGLSSTQRSLSVKFEIKNDSHLFAFFTSQAALPNNIQPHTQLLYTFSITPREKSIGVKKSASWFHLLPPLHIMATTVISMLASSILTVLYRVCQ